MVDDNLVELAKIKRAVRTLLVCVVHSSPSLACSRRKEADAGLAVRKCIRSDGSSSKRSADPRIVGAKPGFGEAFNRCGITERDILGAATCGNLTFQSDFNIGYRCGADKLLMSIGCVGFRWHGRRHCSPKRKLLAAGKFGAAAAEGLLIQYIIFKSHLDRIPVIAEPARQLVLQC